jgi:exonuclease VII small subunit
VNSKTTPASPEQTAASDFERSLAELEAIVEKLEQGDCRSTNRCATSSAACS